MPANALVSHTGAFRVPASGFPDHPEHRGVACFAAEQGVTGFIAEMRDVDDGCRIIGQHMQVAARRQRHQTLARLENGQGAQKPGGIEMIAHVRDVFRCACAVHRLGTIM